MKYALVMILALAPITHAIASSGSSCKASARTDGFIQALLQSQQYQMVEGEKVLTGINVQAQASECLSKVIQIRFQDSSTTTCAVTLDGQTFQYSIECRN